MRFLLPLLLAIPVSADDITLVGVATIPGTATDLSGLTGKQTDGTPHNRLGGHGSAIAYMGRGNEYLLASDRGPKDGATDFACRVHRMTIAVDPRATPAVTVKLTGTTMLTDAAGRSYLGTAAALDRRLDPEGIRCGAGGHFFVSDEYGPAVVEFDGRGRKVRDFALPDRYRPTKTGAKPEDELPPKNTAGRIPNRGMEGLGITPDGKKLVGAMQSPLIQDGGLGKDNARVGLNCRLVEIDRASGRTREFVYPLDHPANGISEILAVTEREFLVLERDSLAGREARVKRVYRIDLSEATDVSRVDQLPSAKLAPEVRPVTKRLFLDLLDPRFKIVGPGSPEKFEGLTFGPALSDGRRTLLVTADNDFVADQPFRVYVFTFGVRP